MNAILNNVPRKKLSDQLDRLDNILDGLADAIPAVVADAVRQAIQQTVTQATKAAIAELLANPDLLRAIQGPANLLPSTTSPPSMPSPPSPPSDPKPRGIVSRVSLSIWNTACSATRKIGGAVAYVSRMIWAGVKAPFQLAIRWGRPVLAAAQALASYALPVMWATI
jgi:hypothetical protein